MPPTVLARLSVAQECELAREVFALSDVDLAATARLGTLRTDMTNATRQSMLEGIDAWLGGDST